MLDADTKIVAPPEVLATSDRLAPADHDERLNDAARLSALGASALMDTVPEEAFDRAVRLATAALGKPVGLLSLVDGQRQFFKAQVGLSGETARSRQTPLSHSFCQYVVSNDAPLAVSDARLDDTLRDNLAVPDLGVIAYLGVPVHSPDGHPLGSLCAIDSSPHVWTDAEQAVLADLAAMIESEIVLRQEAVKRQMLVRELNHRMKNVFGVVSGMVSLTRREAKDTDAMASALRGRIHALAQAHDLIRPAVTDDSTNTRRVALQTLVAAVVSPHVLHQEERVTIDGPALQLGPTTTTHLALVLHELATNAAKYGALSVSRGWLEVTWAINDNALVLDWQEHGGPAIDGDPKLLGFGSQLIDVTVRGQLRGAIETRWGADGAHHTITAPADGLNG